MDPDRARRASMVSTAQKVASCDFLGGMSRMRLIAKVDGSRCRAGDASRLMSSATSLTILEPLPWTPVGLRRLIASTVCLQDQTKGSGAHGLPRACSDADHSMGNYSSRRGKSPCVADSQSRPLHS
ncbi:hypothetical protein LIA77_05507 [Sarocladium implicatum]|nr:hypothetical protein LIA77_05507 [Sarocladium implicatum]